MNSPFEQIFGDYTAAQLRLRHAQEHNDGAQWRPIEQWLIEYFRRRHIPLADGGGTAHVEVVTFSGLDGTETIWISLEDLARRFAAEFAP